MKYRDLSKPERWIIIGIPCLFLIGVVIHFLYDLGGKSPIIGLIAPVNESVWEHLKQVLFPVICWWTLYDMTKEKKYSIDKNKWYTSALIALIISLITIPLLYYFYTQAFGIKLIWVDILILFLAIFLGQMLAVHFYRHGKGICSTFVILIFIGLILIFILFTFYPPRVPLFRDNTTGQYGII